MTQDEIAQLKKELKTYRHLLDAPDELIEHFLLTHASLWDKALRHFLGMPALDEWELEALKE